MQLVHPSVALHYWDFTIDANEFRDGDSNQPNWAVSEIFSEEWFGPMPFTEDGAGMNAGSILNTDKKLSGRWGDVMLGRLRDEGSTGATGIVGEAHNSYGFLLNP
jgi:hypothetical protein